MLSELRPNQARMVEHPPATNASLKILVVEDVRSSLAVLCHSLTAQGYVPIPAGCGSEAIERFLTECPDLVLLDVMLPDMDGYAVARRIRELEKPGGWTPIIFLTGLTGDADLAKGIAAGGDDYLQKPASDVVLRAKIGAMQRIVRMHRTLLATTRKLDAANRELTQLSSMDGLTGVVNRRMFDEALAREWQRSAREGAQLAVAMCDVDFFKKFNDSHGHQAGDDCLKQVAAAMTGVAGRGGDLLARYGGEEFAVILPDTDLEGAVFVTESMRCGVAELRIPHADSPHGEVTISAGVAACIADADNTPEALLHAADQALYQAKQTGRNRVCHTVVQPPEAS